MVIKRRAPSNDRDMLGVCCLADTKAACFRRLVCSEQNAFSFPSVHPAFFTTSLKSYHRACYYLVEQCHVFFLNIERCMVLFIKASLF